MDDEARATLRAYERDPSPINYDAAIAAERRATGKAAWRAWISKAHVSYICWYFDGSMLWITSTKAASRKLDPLTSGYNREGVTLSVYNQLLETKERATRCLLREAVPYFTFRDSDQT